MGRRRSSGSGRPPEPRPRRCWCTRNAGPLVGPCGDDLLANRDPCHRALQLFDAPEVATETLSLAESIAQRLCFWARITPITRRA